MIAGPAPVRCLRCGRSWEVPRRADGSLPKTARCATTRGGCGHIVKVPRRTATAGRAADLPTGTAWNPPSEPRQPRPMTEPCPHCGEAKVYAEPRGTVRVCLGCHQRVTPPGVFAPYERGAEVTRQARSQRERDLEALALAGRKGVMLDQLRALADGDRLDPASVLKAEWFAEQVKAAASAARLDDLAALFAEAGIRPRRWWHGKPAAITAGYDDDDGEDDYAGYDDDGEDQPAGSAVLATPASISGQQHRTQPQRATWADALAARGWQLSDQLASGRCAIVTQDGRRCRDPVGGHPPVTDASSRHGWACTPHYGTLGATISAINRARGIT